jgi:glycosyltransferase involved in cell wall biosynthesis
MYYTNDKFMLNGNENLRLADQRPIRILHVVNTMNRDGIETWLMHILRDIDRDRFQMDFLVHTTDVCAYDQEIRSLGSKIIPCLHPHHPWLYATNFQRILQEHGSYDIIHSHIHHYTGFILYLAQLAGVPIRIAHSHLDTSKQEIQGGWKRHLYLALMKWLIARYATLGFVCSQDAAIDLFNHSWKTDPRWQLLYCGINFQPFQDVVNNCTMRAELGIPADAFVIGHVGRFDPQKNHTFLIEIAAEIAQREPRICLLLVGEGLLRQEVEQQVAQMGLVDKVIFAGTRSDVPRLMLGVMDIFLFPSLYEGLPIVGLEAQAAGLPLVISDVISTELDQVKPLIKRLSLSEPASIWAEAVLAMLNLRSEINQVHSRLTMENSPFNLKSSVNALINVYENQCK